MNSQKNQLAAVLALLFVVPGQLLVEATRLIVFAGLLGVSLPPGPFLEGVAIFHG